MTAVLEPTQSTGTTHLVGDIGGTHLRLALVRPGSDEPQATAVLRCQEFGDLRSAVGTYLEGIASRHHPRAACIAVAAPVVGDIVTLTNSRLSFSIERTRAELGLEELRVVNDVAALARSVTALRHDGLVALSPDAVLRTDRTVAVIAPGTGLGVAALIPTGQGHLVLSGEGGQVPLPSTRSGLDVARTLLRLQGHASCEDLVSGSGLPVLDVALRSLRGEVAPRSRPATAISTSGETAPGQVLQVFSELLAHVVQTHALAFGARGGVVLGGGFLGGLVPVLRVTGFLDMVRHHPKMRSYLEQVPVVVDTRTHPALVGAALFLEDPS